MRGRWALAFVVCSMLSGCSSSAPSASAPSNTGPLTETFSGTLRGSNTDDHLFTVANTGTVSVTLTQATIPSGAFLAVNVATPTPYFATEGMCFPVYLAPTPVQPSSQPQLTVPSIAPGTYCVEVQMQTTAPNGLVTGVAPDAVGAYTLTVTHP